MPPEPHFSLGTFADASGETYAAVVIDDRAIDLGLLQTRVRARLANFPVTIRSLLNDWEAGFASVREAVAAILADGLDHPRWRDAISPLERLRPLPPVYPPGNLFQAGANYRSHVLQLVMARAVGERANERANLDELRTRTERELDERARSGIPYVFVGLPTAICGARDDVVLPHEGRERDWELELAVIFGRAARRVPRERALDYVAGYTICNDLTTRDLVFRPDLRAIGTDWLRGKNAPTFFPTGPYLVPRAFVADPMNLRITLRLNGQVMQDAPTADMIFDVARLIEYTSSITTILPGDMLLTGSPAGNGAHWGRYLQPGDMMEGEITGLGVQINRCVAERDQRS